MISKTCRSVNATTHDGSRREISRSTHPIAFLMKNSVSVSSGSVYRVNRVRGGVRYPQPRWRGSVRI